MEYLKRYHSVLNLSLVFLHNCVLLCQCLSVYQRFITLYRNIAELVKSNTVVLFLHFNHTPNSNCTGTIEFLCCGTIRFDTDCSLLQRIRVLVWEWIDKHHCRYMYLEGNCKVDFPLIADYIWKRERKNSKSIPWCVSKL